MAGLPRVTQVQFGTTGLTGTGGFGAAAAGTITTEAATANTLANLMTGTALAWAGGWLAATLGASKFPAVEDMNAVDYVLSTQIAYLLERGIPEYDAGTSYNIGDICKAIGGTHLYASLTNANIGNALPTWPFNNTNWQSYSPSGRVALTAGTTFYVATTGNDSNPGTVGSPFLTLQHAINYILANIDLAGFTASIQVGDGTYTGGISLASPFVGGGSVSLIGDLVTPANCIINTTSADCINISNGAVLNIAGGFTLETASSGRAISVTENGVVNISGAMVYGACASGHLNITTGGFLAISSNYTISGSAPTHWTANQRGGIQTTGLTATLTGTPAFSSEFANAISGGDIECSGMTFSGSATGTRYSATINGIINTNGGGANYLPGNGAGSVANGGVYV